MKIRTLLIVGLLAAANGVTQLASAGEQTPQQQFAGAVALMASHKYAEAIPLLEALTSSYPTATVFWNLGLSAAEVGDNAKALQAWRAYRELAPDNWQGRAKLVQAYQALGELAARDRERAALVALWQTGSDAELSAQPIFCREQFRQDGQKMMVLEYFKPSGPTMVVYSFVGVNDAGQHEFKLSLGSYDSTNQVALELGQRPADKRLYHLDLYRGKAHETHGFFIGQPDYDEIRSAVVKVLAGKSKPIASLNAPAADKH